MTATRKRNIWHPFEGTNPATHQTKSQINRSIAPWEMGSATTCYKLSQAQTRYWVFLYAPMRLVWGKVWLLWKLPSTVSNVGLWDCLFQCKSLHPPNVSSDQLGSDKWLSSIFLLHTHWASVYSSDSLVAFITADADHWSGHSGMPGIQNGELSS